MIALEHVPPSKFGQLAGQLISAGVIPLSSHLPVILPSSFENATGIFPDRTHAMIVPPGAI